MRTEPLLLLWLKAKLNCPDSILFLLFNSLKNSYFKSLVKIFDGSLNLVYLNDDLAEICLSCLIEPDVGIDRELWSTTILYSDFSKGIIDMEILL